MFIKSDYKLRLQPKKKTEEDLVLAWLSQYPAERRNQEFILPALRASWLVYALIESRTATEKVAIAANEGILWLSRQTDSLRRLAGFPEELLWMPPQVSSKPGLQSDSEQLNLPGLKNIEIGFGDWLN